MAPDFNMLMSLLSAGNNPQQIVQNMVRQNPQFNALLNQQKQSGMSMQDFTMQLARQNNIDIQPLVQMLQQKGIK